jgi:DNA-binding XRE family transcriptional regulator
VAVYTRNVNEMIDSLPKARRRKIEKRGAELIAEELTLQELRRARELTQVKMAKTLGVAQKQNFRNREAHRHAYFNTAPFD